MPCVFRFSNDHLRRAIRYSGIYQAEALRHTQERECFFSKEDVGMYPPFRIEPRISGINSLLILCVVAVECD